MYPFSSDIPLSARFRSIYPHRDTILPSFYLTVDFLGLRRNGSWSQIIDQAQYFSEQVPWHSNLGQLEGDITAMSHDLRADLDEHLL